LGRSHNESDVGEQVEDGMFGQPHTSGDKLTSGQHVLAAALLILFCPLKGSLGLARTSDEAPASSSRFIVGVGGGEPYKASARAREAVWRAWLAGEPTTIRAEFRPKDRAGLVIDFHVFPRDRVSLVCAVPCAAWKLKPQQFTTIERRLTPEGRPIGENERLPPTSYRIVFLNSDKHVVFWL
jgi:hypothetical protein